MSRQRAIVGILGTAVGGTLEAFIGWPWGTSIVILSMIYTGWPILFPKK